MLKTPSFGRQLSLVSTTTNKSLVKLNRSASLANLRALKLAKSRAATMHIRQSSCTDQTNVDLSHVSALKGLVKEWSKKPLKNKYDSSSSSASPNLPTEKESKKRPDKSIVQLFLMVAVYFGIELLFSMEIALTVPILKELGISENAYSYVYLVSPLLGFVLQPVLGVLSDRCQSRFGRRRPFILVLSFGAFIGLVFLLNGKLISQWFGVDLSKSNIVPILLTALGLLFLEFSADSCVSPMRALILDTCNQKDRDTALNIQIFLGGTGAALGYILTGISWSRTFLSFLGSDTTVLCVLCTIFFVVSVAMTLNAVKEAPFRLSGDGDGGGEATPAERLVIESYEMKVMSVGEFSLKIEHNTMPLDEQRASENARQLIEMNEDEDDDNDDDDDNSDEDEEEDEEPPIGLRTLLRSFLTMPNELTRLLIVHTIGFMSFFSVTLFFTDLVAETIFKGNSTASSNSTEFYRYEEGVKMGSFCLLVFSISTAISAIVLEKYLLTRFSTKRLFLATFAIYGVSCLVIFFLDNIYAIMPLCASFGVLFTSLGTLPYQMISDFNEIESYWNKSPSGTRRGVGIDCSLLCSCYFLAQSLVSLYTSPLTAAFGNRAILIAGSLISLLAFVFTAFFLKFPQKKPTSGMKDVNAKSDHI